MVKKIAEFLSSKFPFLNFLNNETARIIWVRNKLVLIPKGENILDAGAGEGRYKKYCFHLKYVSQDFGQYDGKGDGIGIQTKEWDNSQLDIVSDIIDIPVGGESFDNILCTEVLEHIPAPELAIKEFSRILKKGGTLILTAPFCSLTHFAPFHFCSGFNFYWYSEVLRKYDFEILEISSNGNFFDYLCQELLRTPFVVKRYSNFWYFGFFLYIPILPLVFLLKIFSKISEGSERQLCFGYHVLARKRNVHDPSGHQKA